MTTVWAPRDGSDVTGRTWWEGGATLAGDEGGFFEGFPAGMHSFGEVILNMCNLDVKKRDALDTQSVPFPFLGYSALKDLTSLQS